MDSLRRQLNRMGVATAIAPMRQLWTESHLELINQGLIKFKSDLLRPRPGRDMIERPFKSPYTYRYVVELTHIDPQTGLRHTNAISIYDQDQITKGEAQRRARAWAERTPDPRRKSGYSEGTRIVGAELINAYVNEGTDF